MLKAEDNSFWSEVMLVGIGSPGTSSGNGRRLLSCRFQEKYIFKSIFAQKFFFIKPQKIVQRSENFLEKKKAIKA